MKIAISGKAGSGKTTLAEVFVKEYGFKRVSFANKLKQLAMDLFGLSHEEVYGELKNRKLLQDLGLKMREIKDSVWIDYAIRQVDNDDNYVIDDVRYKNELDALKKAGFIIIRIEADSNVRRNRIPYTFPADETHASETDLDDYNGWDAVIDNNDNDLQAFINNAHLIVKLYK